MASERSLAIFISASSQDADRPARLDDENPAVMASDLAPLDQLITSIAREAKQPSGQFGTPKLDRFALTPIDDESAQALEAPENQRNCCTSQPPTLNFADSSG